MNKKYKYIYGPVASWRLGSSLGIDLLSQEEKICDFNCIYCQLGPTLCYTTKRQYFILVKEIIKEIESLPTVHIDYITFAGSGEPTLAKNLGQAIRAVKALSKTPVAVLTNSSLLHLNKVRQELLPADYVSVKLDAGSPDSLQAINDPAKDVCFEKLLSGIIKFRKQYQGWLALQIMFVNKNMQDVDKMINLIKQINPDEVQINTPLRVCAVKPLSKESIRKIRNTIAAACKKVAIVSVYDKNKSQAIYSISDAETLKRRGKVIK
ncbi:MAG: radical SAM protein [bacterium]|nr:radical SAM protein [bacterium]MDD5756603.1 radical SAM protein [bacterium]